MIVINLNNWAYYTILIQEQTEKKQAKLGAGDGNSEKKKI